MRGGGYNKKTFLLVLFFLIFSSCIYHESIMPERFKLKVYKDLTLSKNQVAILFHTSTHSKLKIITVDGKTINEIKKIVKSKSRVKNFAAFELLPGFHTFEVIALLPYIGGCSITFSVEAGHKYRLSLSRGKEIASYYPNVKEYEVYVTIEDITTKLGIFVAQGPIKREISPNFQ